ncbi:MAG: amidohydrolase family protein [Thermoleophilaceae bacterium]
MYSDEVIRPWFDRLMADLGSVPALFDAHTHTGASDPDGFRCSAEALREGLAAAGGARGVVFTMHEPDGYTQANDRVLAEAAASGGALIPFCRLDPRDSPLEEAERCLAAGARGIKLHPRAEQFLLADEEARPIFALAHERRLPVLVHAGRGIPALGRHALDLCAAYPGMRMILAHAGISDLSWLWRHAPDHPNLFFDTSWWAPDDLLALFRLVPPGQILFGSDTPYGTPLTGAVIALRCALQAGLDAEQAHAVGGGQLERLLAGEDAADLGPAPGDPVMGQDLLLGRVATFLTAAFGRMVRGQDGDEQLALARLACVVPPGSPQEPVCRSLIAIFDRLPPAGFPDEAPIPFMPGVHALSVALIVARTPSVGLPDAV